MSLGGYHHMTPYVYTFSKICLDCQNIIFYIDCVILIFGWLDIVQRNMYHVS